MPHFLGVFDWTFIILKLIVVPAVFECLLVIVLALLNSIAELDIDDRRLLMDFGTSFRTLGGWFDSLWKSSRKHQEK